MNWAGQKVIIFQSRNRNCRGVGVGVGVRVGAGWVKKNCRLGRVALVAEELRLLVTPTSANSRANNYKYFISRLKTEAEPS
jgi:hypothetical protein